MFHLGHEQIVREKYHGHSPFSFLDRTLEPKHTSGNVPDNETFGSSTEDFEESQNSQYESQQDFIEGNELNSQNKSKYYSSTFSGAKN